MRGFHGCFLLMLLLFFITPSMAGRQNPLFELNTNTELVEVAGYGEEKLSSVLVTGTVICEACLGKEAALHASPISGALVAVTCKSGGKRRKSNWPVQGTTDEYGDFIIHLPSHLHATPYLDKVCSVRVLGMPKNSCYQRVFVGKPQGIRLSSVGNGIRTYTTGSMSFRKTSKTSHKCSKKEGSGGDEQEISW